MIYNYRSTSVTLLCQLSRENDNATWRWCHWGSSGAEMIVKCYTCALEWSSRRPAVALAQGDWPGPAVKTFHLTLWCKKHDSLVFSSCHAVDYLSFWLIQVVESQLLFDKTWQLFSQVLLPPSATNWQLVIVIKCQFTNNHNHSNHNN